MPLPKTLVENMSLGRCIPWCGAGISMASKMPSWAQLVRSFVEACDEAGMKADAVQEVSNLGAEDAVEVCRDFLGENEYRSFLERTISANAVPNLLHQKIVDLPVPAFLTSNYDQLLETSFAAQKGTIPRSFTADDTQSIWKAIAKEEQFVLKVNGDIARPNTVVLTSRDYTRHVFGNPTFMAVIQRIILSYSILFIGSSLSDIYVRRILEEATFMTGQVGMPHFALMCQDHIGPLRAKLLRDPYNIFVVPYATAGHDHQKPITEFLDDLTTATDSVSHTA